MLALVASLASLGPLALAPTAAEPTAPADPATVTSVVDESVGAEPQAASTLVNAATRDDLEGDGSWLDVGHAFIEHRIFAPALRVDRFFSDERDLEAERARSFIQWRQEVRFQQHRSAPTYGTTVSANLKLPGLDQRLRGLQIEISGQSRDAYTALFPGKHATPGEVPASDVGFGTDAGIGYRVFETISSTVASRGDLGAGLIFRFPVGFYTRARLRFGESLGAGVLARQALSGFWRTDTHLGTTAQASLERPLASSTLARLSGSTTLTERSRGLEWGGDLSLLATLRARVGAQLGFGVSGATREAVAVDVYRFFLRLRRDVYRKWLFLELAPEYGWPWEEGVGRRGTWAVALRLEVQFHGNEAPRVPAPDAPEPADPVEWTGGRSGTSALPGAPAPR